MKKRVVIAGIIAGVIGLSWLGHLDNVNQKKKLDKLYKEGIFSVRLAGYSTQDANIIVDCMLDDSCDSDNNVDLAKFRQKLADFSAYR